METVTLTRTLGDTEVTASVVPAGKAWPVAMLVQVRVRQGRAEWVQHFESVEEAERSGRVLCQAPQAAGKQEACAEHDCYISAYGAQP